MRKKERKPEFIRIEGDSWPFYYMRCWVNEVVAEKHLRVRGLLKDAHIVNIEHIYGRYDLAGPKSVEDRSLALKIAEKPGFGNFKVSRIRMEKDGGLL